jgi:hypothetical protein
VEQARAVQQADMQSAAKCENGIDNSFGPLAGWYPMDREQIVAKLREHEPELKAAGVEHLLGYDNG